LAWWVCFALLWLGGFFPVTVDNEEEIDDKEVEEIDNEEAEAQTIRLG